MSTKEVLGWGCAAIVALVFVVVIVTGLAVYAGLLQLPLMNIQREVTTHSQPYIQTQQQVMLHYYADYQSSPDEAHKNAAKTNVCATAALLDPSEYPVQLQGFVAANCN